MFYLVNLDQLALAVLSIARLMRTRAAGVPVFPKAGRYHPLAQCLAGNSYLVALNGAVIAMTRSLSSELGTHGITVNAIAPGLIRVEATDYVPQQRKDYYVSAAAIQRPHEPQDTIGAAVFLLSDAAAFISRQMLPVNGGLISA